MFGMIHRAARQMVVSMAGRERWARGVELAGVPAGGFISTMAYSDEMTWSIVDATARAMNYTLSEALRHIGEYWINFTVGSRYGEIVDIDGGGLLMVLQSRDRIHTAINEAMPEARMPSFRLVNACPEAIWLTYSSSRQGLEPFVASMLIGLVRRFEIDGEVSYLEPPNGGANFVIALAA